MRGSVQASVRARLLASQGLVQWQEWAQVRLLRLRGGGDSVVRSGWSPSGTGWVEDLPAKLGECAGCR